MTSGCIDESADAAAAPVEWQPSVRIEAYQPGWPN